MKRIFLFSGIFFSCLSLCVFASDTQEQKEKEQWRFPYTKEVGIISGYAHGNLKEQGSYKIIPVIVRLGYNLDSMGFGFCDLIRPVASKLDMEPKGFTEFMLELNFNTVVRPDSNVESGAAILLKYSYPLTEKIYPYVLGGGGMAYITLDTREEATQWGFTPQIGTGITYFLQKDLALNMEYRYRHFSNANIKEPNEGINVNMFLFGFSWYY
jgi:opacity protein-like surface antigen